LRNIPALRFSTFKEDYRFTNIGNETEKVLSGRTPNKLDSTIWGEDIPWITSGDIHQKYIFNGDLFLNEISTKDLGLHVIPRHSVLMGTAGQGKTRCTVGTNERELCTNDAMLSMIPNNDVYYLYLLFLLEGKYQHLRLLTPQETKTRLSTNNLKSFKINLPSFEEQRKVANFIYSVETKIILLKKKLENLKLFKKGLIQNEFTFTKNKEIKLEKLIIEYSKRNKELEVKRVLSVTNSRGFITQDEMFDRSVASSDISTYKIVRKGQFGYNPSRINVGSIDLLTTFDEGVLSPIYVIFYCNGNKLDSQYLKYWFESHSFRGNMKKYIEGGVRDTLSFTNLSSMKMPLPSVEEQVEFNKRMNPITHKIEMLEHYTITLKQFNIPHPIKLQYNMVIFTKEVKNEYE
jgi:type I restriction enzyme S subunit